jgi:SRSO17 transposase
LSDFVDHTISHDKITRFLATKEYSSKDWRSLTKPIIREINEEDDCLIFDDTIGEKPSTDESELVTRHFDHSKGRSVKGINLLTALLNSKKHNMNIPLEFANVIKDKEVEEDEKIKRKATKSKNEMMIEMVGKIHRNHVKFAYILADARFFNNIVVDCICKIKKNFIMEMPKSRLIALSKKDRLA